MPQLMFVVSAMTRRVIDHLIRRKVSLAHSDDDVMDPRFPKERSCAQSYC